MPPITTTLEYLIDLPIYQHEKPYWALNTAGSNFDPSIHRSENLSFASHDNILVRDIRDLPVSETPTLSREGFQVLNLHVKQPNADEHERKHDGGNLAGGKGDDDEEDHEQDAERGGFTFETKEDTETYMRATASTLKQELGAEFVKCYDMRLRRNVRFQRACYDFNDFLTVEGPAQGVHVDVTTSSGPEIICRYLSTEEQEKYLKPGYRIRIVNTWRPLNPTPLLDRPLALCAYPSVTLTPQTTDLIPTDRIMPDRTGEVYYLKYNPAHRWYWLEKQRREEVFLMLMFDTAPGEGGARFCPHVSFISSRTPEGAPKRESVETRSIVVSKI